MNGTAWSVATGDRSLGLSLASVLNVALSKASRLGGPLFIAVPTSDYSVALLLQFRDRSFCCLPCRIVAGTVQKATSEYPQPFVAPFQEQLDPVGMNLRYRR